MFRPILLSGVALGLGLGPAAAQVSPDIITSLSAPDRVDTRAGRLEFRDGVPTEETAQRVYDMLDFTRALDVYNNSFRGASALAIVKGFEGIGAKPGDVVIFSELMDANSLFLTANADTVYYLTGLDLSQGPVVVEQPRGRGESAPGAIDKRWAAKRWRCCPTCWSHGRSSARWGSSVRPPN